MSDSDGDFSDELLELAGATEKKRKRREGSSKSEAKRRKAAGEMDSTSDADGPESEEENPYPLEGKYIDEYDRQRLLEMPEIEREEVLAQRLEELQRITDKRNLDQMLKAQKAGDGDSIVKAAKRQHTIRGATKEKSRKLDELKAKRKAKDERKRTRGSPKRDRSSSPMEMETSDDEEDGQITKFEQEEEKERKLFGMAHPNDEPMTLEDLNKARLTRDSLAKHFLAPWFEDYVKGAYVRYLVGPDKYRIYEIHQVQIHTKHYKINDNITCNLALELKYGSSIDVFPMDKVSNVDFTEAELGRFKLTWETSRIKLPMKRDLEKKTNQMAKLVSQPMTESDIAAMLRAKSQLQGDSGKPQAANWAKLERGRLTQLRTLAVRRNDKAEVTVLDAQLADLAVESPPVPTDLAGDASALLAKVNERNRKANLEAIRRAELQEAERKRRERRLGTPTALDPSARLRTVPRLFASRSTTPNPGGSPAPDAHATPSKNSSQASAVPAQSPSKAGTNGKGDFHARVLETIEIDLGDF
ncbi:plus-3-domain-containing protein [Lactarius akahatsu]|uniref:Plus-3-domain-containing protein n=1 Tax=Lactarius akahatsu TaxID=416441 RepID=A0AAD4L323_9AGAM|nr:plus-3-domain-containing protein [Lactarius akahatsu]